MATSNTLQIELACEHKTTSKSLEFPKLWNDESQPASSAKDFIKQRMFYALDTATPSLQSNIHISSI